MPGGGPCWADCCNFLHVGWHPRRNHAYQILSPSRLGLRSYGGPKSGFSYSFLNGSYNSVTHYVLHCDNNCPSFTSTAIQLKFCHNDVSSCVTPSTSAVCIFKYDGRSCLRIVAFCAERRTIMSCAAVVCVIVGIDSRRRAQVFRAENRR